MSEVRPNTQAAKLREAQQEINKFHYEFADENEPIFPVRYGFGIDAPLGAGVYTSGYLVKRMIEAQERQMQNQGR